MRSRSPAYFKTLLFSIYLVGGPVGLISSAHAAEIILKNGDRMNGTIISKEGKYLKLSTKYAGDLTISWQEVDSFSAADSIILFKNGEMYQGAVQSRSPGKISITTAGHPIDTDRVDYINPPPYLLGNGISWKGHVNGSMVITDGNSNTENLHIDSEFQARTKENRYTIGGMYKRTEDSGAETEASSRGYLKYDYFFTKKVYGLANTSLEKDRFKDLNLRTTAGLGIGYQVIESTRTNLAVELGLNYIKEDFIASADKEMPAGRWAVKYDIFTINSLLQFIYGHELYVSLEDSEDLLLNAQTGFKIPATQKLYVSLQVNFDWDNTPAAGKKRSDTMYLFGLGYTL